MNASNMKASALLVVVICLGAPQAQACGEVMLRTLGAMRYHPFVTRHPAQILLYSGDEAVHRAPADDTKLQNSLEKVGHKVAIARGPEELARALAAHHYDVVIAPADHMVGVTTRITNHSHEPIVIHMLDKATDEQQLRARFPRLVDGNANDLLKAIELVMKAQEA